jgi:hypothetical protein
VDPPVRKAFGLVLRALEFFAGKPLLADLEVGVLRWRPARHIAQEAREQTAVLCECRHQGVSDPILPLRVLVEDISHSSVLRERLDHCVEARAVAPGIASSGLNMTPICSA